MDEAGEVGNVTQQIPATHAHCLYENQGCERSESSDLFNLFDAESGFVNEGSGSFLVLDESPDSFFVSAKHADHERTHGVDHRLDTVFSEAYVLYTKEKTPALDGTELDKWSKSSPNVNQCGFGSGDLDVVDVDDHEAAVCWVPVD